MSNAVPDQMSGGTFFSYEICIRGAMPSSFVAVSVARSTYKFSSNRAREMFSPDDISRIPCYQGLDYGQQDPLNLDPGKLP